MSTKKYTNVEVAEIHGRLMQALDLKTKTDLAVLLGISVQSLGNREARGVKAINDITLLCNSRRLNLEWVLTGKGTMRPSIAADASTGYGVTAIHRTLTPEENEALEILRVYPDVLEMVEAFMQLPPRKQKIYLGKLLEEVDKLRDEGLIPPCITT